MVKRYWWAFALLGLCSCGLVALISLAYIPIDSISRPDNQAAAPPTTAPAKKTGLIPGLNPADITVNLEREKFDCTQAKKGERGFTWTCIDSGLSYYYQVDVFSRSIFTVDRVHAAAIRYDSKLEKAAPFLGFVATAPYDGSSPEAARRWVKHSLDSNSSQVFGGITYKLSRSGKNINLTIGGQ